MNYYARIVTTDPSAIVWSVDYVHAILGELNTIPNVTFAVDIVYRDLVPEVINERISHAFMDTLREGGADFIWLHISEAQRKKWGLKPTLRGLNHRDRDSVGEMYFWADEGTKRGRYIQFIETALHEIRHEIMKGSGQYDNTHEIHPTSKSLLGTFKDIDMSTYRPLRQLQRTLFHRLLDRLLASMKPTVAPQTLHPRFNKTYRISQGYGVKNSIYKLTGRHIGIDWATPIGTAILAPADGEITVVGTHGSLGKFCYFEYKWEGKNRVERFLHLNAVPKVGTVARGKVVAYSGNTGFSTGAHTHVDGWWDEVKIGSINSKNWDTLTYDPHIA